MKVKISCDSIRIFFRSIKLGKGAILLVYLEVALKFGTGFIRDEKDAYDLSEKRRTLHVNVGEWAFSEERTEFKTLLGSCISVCLYDPISKCGGINHIMLPGRSKKIREADLPRFGINAMEILINEFVKRGIPRFRLKSKLVGGGFTLGKEDVTAIGSKNVSFARNFLAEEGIAILGEDTGGPFYRHLRFYTDSFEVFVRKVNADQVDAEIDSSESSMLQKFDAGRLRSTPTYFD